MWLPAPQIKVLLLQIINKVRVSPYLLLYISWHSVPPSFNDSKTEMLSVPSMCHGVKLPHAGPCMKISISVSVPRGPNSKQAYCQPVLSLLPCKMNAFYRYFLTVWHYKQVIFPEGFLLLVTVEKYKGHKKPPSMPSHFFLETFHLAISPWQFPLFNNIDTTGNIQCTKVLTMVNLRVNKEPSKD